MYVPGIHLLLRLNNKVFYQIWDSETEALDYALDAGIGLYESWAIVVFDDLDPGAVDFTIRMNYTIVPDTGEVCMCCLLYTI